jgi:DNA repair exonuclease SbcCD ATPase subunit
MRPDEKEAYQRKIEAKVDQWRAELDKLRAQAREAQAEGRLQAISSLKTLQQEATRRLEELKAAGESGWQDARQAVDRVVTEFESAYQRLVR